MNIKLLVLRCADIKVSKEFYELLGFGFNKEQHGKGPIHYASEQSTFVLELYPALENENENDNTRLGLEIDALDSKIDNLSIIDEYEYNGREVKVTYDPDGRKLELYESQP